MSKKNITVEDPKDIEFLNKMERTYEERFSENDTDFINYCKQAKQIEVPVLFGFAPRQYHRNFHRYNNTNLTNNTNPNNNSNTPCK